MPFLKENLVCVQTQEATESPHLPILWRGRKIGKACFSFGSLAMKLMH
jgi:hypothetical protein